MGFTEWDAKKWGDNNEPQARTVTRVGAARACVEHTTIDPLEDALYSHHMARPKHTIVFPSQDHTGNALVQIQIACVIDF